jgi:hypothetical protein
MNTATRVRFGFILLACAATAGAQTARPEPEGARYVATVLTANSQPKSILRRDIERDCSALEKNAEGPGTECAAVQCATGFTPAWSMCPKENGPAAPSR